MSDIFIHVILAQGIDVLVSKILSKIFYKYLLNSTTLAVSSTFNRFHICMVDVATQDLGGVHQKEVLIVHKSGYGDVSHLTPS